MTRKRRDTKIVQSKKEVDPLHCGTITVEDQIKMRRAADRNEQIASGMLRPVGTGAHWKGKKGESKASRRDARRYERSCRDD